MRMKTLKFILVSIGLAKCTLGAQLPKNIDAGELSTMIKTLAFSNVTRSMRSAEAYPLYPGLKISLETSVVSSKELNEMGDGTASLPPLIPSTRLNISKGWGGDIETSFNISTQNLLKTISTVGFLGKWMIQDERDSFASTAIFSGVTILNGFNESFKGTEYEVGFLMSKDYVRLKPYVGAGLLLASATVSKVVSPRVQSDSVFSPHLFLGAEIELPMNIALQLDFTQLVPTGSVALGYHF